MQIINIVITEREARQLQKMAPHFFYDDDGEKKQEDALARVVHDLIHTETTSYRVLTEND